ncbi:MAG TPA: hypothetical protein VGC90_04635 [Candidatus Limnocylindrales bacterium]
MTGKSVAEKLGIKPGTMLWTSDPSRIHLVDPLPDGVRAVDDLTQASTAIVFAPDERSIRGVLSSHDAALGRVAALWVLYPKASRADINRDSLWPILAEHGFRPITQIAVDEVWSALRFRKLNAAEVAAANPPRSADPTAATR